MRTNTGLLERTNRIVAHRATLEYTSSSYLILRNGVSVREKSKKTLKKFTAADYKVRACQAMNFISRNLDRDLSLDEIAEVALFSKFHFHRIFKSVVGETVAGFTRRLRLERAAARLIANPMQDITEIAYGCGFSSSQNFAKAFRQHFALSPTEFRKSKNGNKFGNNGNGLRLHVTYDLETVSENQPNLKRESAINAEVKEMPERTVAYIRKMGAYGKEIAEQAFAELMQWAGPRDLVDKATTLGVYWDHPEVTPPEKCRIDACIEVPQGTKIDGPVDLQTISGGKYVTCRFEVTTDNFQQAWDDSFAHVVSKGYELGETPCYELYHNNGAEDPDGKWIFDICLPLKSSN
jgi:AraC family transcriptional regulator